MAFDTDSEDDYVPPKDESGDDDDDDDDDNDDVSDQVETKRKSTSRERSGRSSSRPRSTSRPCSRTRARSTTDPPKSSPTVLAPLDWGSDAEEASRGRSRKRKFDELSETYSDYYSDYVPPKSRPSPLKRQKKPVNTAYVALLNTGIDDTVAGTILADPPPLAFSQVGLTVWTAAEKTILHETVARCGRFAVPTITSRLPQKSEAEVLQYLYLLDRSITQLREKHKLQWLTPMSIPAAVEVGPECCNALEEAADALSLRQEEHEARLEKERWGNHIWDVTLPIARELRKYLTHPDDMDLSSLTHRKVDFAVLFELRTWLFLSERIFMNSSDPDRNWRHVDDRPPSVWATAFEDFYSLALSLTRRLVHTALQFAESRIRARGGGERVVTKRDVETTVACLGVRPNSSQFWAQCSRRLKVRVVDGEKYKTEDEEVGGDAMDIDTKEPHEMGVEDSEDDADIDIDQGPSILSYDDMEKALDDTEYAIPTDTSIKIEPEHADDQDCDADIEDLDNEHNPPINDTSSSIDNSDSPIDDTIRPDVHEALLYSATSLPQTRHARSGVIARVRSELAQEALADRHDALASAREDAFLCKLLNIRHVKIERSVSAVRRRTQSMSRARTSSSGGIAQVSDNEVRTNLDDESRQPSDMDVDAEKRPPPVSSFMGNTLVPEHDWRKCIDYFNEWEAVEEQQRRAARGPESDG